MQEMEKESIKDMSFGDVMPKICAPITGAHVCDIIEEGRLICDSKADLVEWRVDFFEDALNTNEVLSALSKLKEQLGNMSILFSFRTAEEGGEKVISLKDYVALNKAVIESGYIDLVDIELFKGEKVVKELVKSAKEHKVWTVISNHDFEKTPSVNDMVERASSAYELGADFPKIAVMPVNKTDLLMVLDASLTLKSSYPGREAIMIAMGKSGLLSRIGAEIFGSSITFASVKNASAPGQISVDQMYSILKLLHEAR